MESIVLKKEKILLKKEKSICVVPGGISKGLESVYKFSRKRKGLPEDVIDVFNWIWTGCYRNCVRTRARKVVVKVLLAL